MQLRAALATMAVAALAGSAAAQDTCPECGAKRERATKRLAVVESKPAAGRIYATRVAPQTLTLVAPQDGDDGDRLKREILREVDRRIAKQLDELRQDIRRMLAERDGPRAPRVERPAPPAPPELSRGLHGGQERGDRMRELAAQMRRRAAESRERAGRAARDAESHQSRVEVQRDGGRATIRIEVDGQVIEREIDTHGPRSIDIPVPGGKVTIRVDRRGHVSVESDAKGHGRAFAQGRPGPGHDGAFEFDFDWDGDPEQLREHFERFGQDFGKRMERWGQAHGREFEGLAKHLEELGKRWERGEGGARAWVLPPGELRELRQAAPDLQRRIEELLRELEGGRRDRGDQDRDDRPRPNRKAPRQDRQGESF